MPVPDLDPVTVPIQIQTPPDGVRVSAEDAATRQPGAHRRPARAAWWLFAVTAAAYVTGGLWLSYAHDSIMSDALSRTANGYYPLFSRDPHLAAVGFVWNPLPSFAQMPLLPLAKIWAPFAQRGVAAIVQSALFMAGAVVQFRNICLQLRARARFAWALTALFALHPEIAYYGMNGMSEASFLFFLLLAARELTRWARDGASNPLAGAGLALGGAYLTRYETVAAGVTTAGFVGLVAYLRADGDRRSRRMMAIADMIVITLPFLFTFAVWAITSSLIIGSPFAQFTSSNGNSAQTKLSSSGISSVVDQPGGPLGYLFDQSRLLEPCGLLIVLAALALCWRRRDVGLLAPMVVLGGAYAFSVAALLTGQTFGWLRFSITVVPLVLLAAATVVAREPAAPLTAADTSRLRRLAAVAGALANRAGVRRARTVAAAWRTEGQGRLRRCVRLALPALILIMLAAAEPVAARGLLNPRLAREESYFLTEVFAPDRASPEQREVAHRYVQDRGLARWLDAQRLPRGSVLLDAADGYEVVLSSRRPVQFAITPDRDFRELLGDPKDHGIRYLVTRNATSLTPADAVADAYPDLQTNPAFRLVRVQPDPGDLPAWHVYAVRP
jgi:hypothetical protein